MKSQPSQKVINGLIYGLGVGLPIAVIIIELSLWFFYWNKSNAATTIPPVVKTESSFEPDEEEEQTEDNLFLKHTSNDILI